MSEGERESSFYKEVAATRFSLASFPWREVKVRSLSSSFKQTSKAVNTGSCAGGFSYRDSGVVSSTCRNRSILWQYETGVLSLVELSLDVNLASNALRLVFESPTTVLLGNDIHEQEDSSVVVSFSTTVAVYRLVLPHPEDIAKDPALSAAGEGLVPSVLAFCSEQSFIGANAAPLFGLQDKPVAVSGCASILSVNGGTTFALPSPSGSIFIVQLPPPDNHVLPTRSELRESSVINKLWNSFMPAVVKGSGEAEDAPVSLALHMFGGEAVALALCKGLQLKVWSVQQSQCVLTHSLLDYLQTDEDTNAKEDQLELRKAAFGTSSSLRFAVHMRLGLVSQVSIFQLLLVDSQLLLQPLQTYRCPQNSSLVDFHLTNSELWGVWMCRGGEGREEEEVVVKQAVYDNEFPTYWRGVSLEDTPPDDVLILPQTDPREVYLECLFHPGRFSTAAICKALELYGLNNINEGAISREDLIKLVTQQVENELQQSASSAELQHDEYRELSTKCWAKFFRFCLEYHHLIHRPTGIFQDPVTGMGLLVKRGVVSFLQPANLTEYVTSMEGNTEEASLQSGDITAFIQAVMETTKQLNHEVLDSFLLELSSHGNSPTTMAMEIAAALHEEGGDNVLVSKLSSLTDLPAVLDLLLEAIDPTAADRDQLEDMEDAMGDDSEFQVATSQLCTSYVAMVMLGSTLQCVCLSRLCLCRDVLVVLCALRLTEKMEVSPAINKTYIPAFTRLLHCYRTLHWLVTRPTLTTTSGTFEANMKLLASLEITPRKNMRNLAGHSSTLAELFVSTHGHSEIFTELARGHVLSMTTPLQPHWSVLTPKIVNSLLRSLWPMTSSCNVCQFLLSNCQYFYVQEFVTQVRAYVSSSWYSLEFLLGESFLGNGELEKAFDCFIQAAAGVGHPSEPLLQRVCGVGVEGDRSEASEEEGVVNYYIKAMRLFEQFPSPSHVIKVAEVATSVAKNDDPGAAILWSTLFKCQLDFGHSREAYDAMMGNPDPIRRKECLRRLVVVLTEQKRLKELCDFTYSGMEEEIEKVIELRARSVDVTKHSYYDLLYCFHTSRGNYRKAAYVMYEHGLRLGREAPGPKSLHKQANCYCMALTALRLTEAKYAWVVRPVEVEEVAVSGKKTSRRKRLHPTLKGTGKTRVQVLTIPDIEKEYLLVKAKLSLIQREPSLTTQLSSPFVSTEEVSSLLVQVGLFDKAITIVQSFSLPLAPVFEALATRCVHLSVNVVSFRQSSANTTTWDWLGLNESACVTTVRENTIADKAWNMLRAHLESHDSSADYVLQNCVARKLLSMGAQLPQWLVDTYKVTNPAELLKLYLTFDLLEPAAKLALEYIDSVMGHGKEFFGVKTALHAKLPSVWLPYSSLDHLRMALRDVPPRSILKELSDQLNDKLDQYFDLTAKTSFTMEQEGRHDGRHNSRIDLNSY